MIPTKNYSACTSMIVGKNASIDGSIMIARNEDSKSSWPKNYVIHPHQEFDTEQEFSSNDNGFKLPLPKVRAKYSATPEWTAKFGLFEEDGINEYGVAMSATESTYTNEYVLGADPLEKDGIGEEAMITVVLPYIKTAREGVKRLGRIIEYYGTSESNGILFADKNEAWYMETGGGHNWVAVKIPDDSYAVIANQTAIQYIDFQDPENYLWSTHIRQFVEDHQLNPDPTGSTFNFRQIFGTATLSDTYYNTPRVWYGLKLFSPDQQHTPVDQDMPFLNQANRKLSVFDVQDFLASHYQGTPYDPIGEGSEADKHRFRPISLAKTQEAHILQIRPSMPTPAAGIQWLAMGVAAQSSFVPFYAGATDTPKQYQNATGSYSADQAYWTYKLAGTLVDPHYVKFGPKLSETQKQLRIAFQQSIQAADKVVRGLSNVEQADFLTKINFENSQEGLNAYNSLISDLVTNATDLSPLNFKQDVNL
ncbi:C69 family dipeptidase [Lentilactobacillus sp. TOM.63]|uniref:C69 family dipeptidase n=1 Tax=Lentilactobacillus sp. TOM.63 TaxID=3055077 RepID=UPI0025A05717|nr:C69 family dipeptidase [Lentilactobacillus sp. TOM.63]MDM7515864.1 C69 family dipeptidase [Lentilactobacillus sp. TOM.63]